MVEQIAAADLTEWLAASTAASKPLLLDVREPAECRAASIRVPGADLLQWPMGTIPARLKELDASRPTAVLCHLGGRSLQVATFLDHRGFAHVANVVGGIDAWSLQVDPDVPRY